eukprot:CAMPEP_0198618062 /NCGR_PEP_ID=MMETSP1462-20131121/160704_1 /TAXON_ID=1333877 /ORGANISM="Brandtodinium nutriculum, Strain RCC3387" /LENGTH=32 /DNA_ID= /DNA_START= /DNA_END= /DNA_ORIENTATION=
MVSKRCPEEALQIPAVMSSDVVRILSPPGENS